MDNNEILVERHQKEMEKHTRKQKLRDARRKSGVKGSTTKPRRKKLNHNNWKDWDDLDTIEFENTEPIMPRGERERRQKIEKQIDKKLNKGPLSDGIGGNIKKYHKDTVDMIPGLVIAAGSGMCRVEINGELLICDIRGSVKDSDTNYVNSIAAGDRVQITRSSSERGIVEHIEPRKNVLTRPYSPDVGKTSGLEQIIVANIDQVVIVASWREPYIWPALIDRYLIAAERNDKKSILCINKIDLVKKAYEYNSIINTYKEIGIPIIQTSAKSGQGVQGFQDILRNKTTVLAGLSGVGKSSLLTAIQPELNIKIGSVSDHGLYTGQGKHTTTQATLWKLENDSVVVDTPGVRSFGLAGILPEDLSSWYPEMTLPSQECRFGDCTHITEPDCGVIAAVDIEQISRLRYKNYIQIFEELSAL